MKQSAVQSTPESQPAPSRAPAPPASAPALAQNSCAWSCRARARARTRTRTRTRSNRQSRAACGHTDSAHDLAQASVALPSAFRPQRFRPHSLLILCPLPTAHCPLPTSRSETNQTRFSNTAFPLSVHWPSVACFTSLHHQQPNPSCFSLRAITSFVSSLHYGHFSALTSSSLKHISRSSSYHLA